MTSSTSSSLAAAVAAETSALVLANRVVQPEGVEHRDLQHAPQLRALSGMTTVRSWAVECVEPLGMLRLAVCQA
jgi:hypothetical protein